MKKSHFVIPIFIPHSGCPFQCVFCNQKNITGKLQAPSVNETEKIIEMYLKTIGNRAMSVLIGFYGGNFTGLDKRTQQQYLKVAKKYLDTGSVQAIRISTRPDCIDEAILSNLREWGVSQIELGIQSFSDYVLAMSQRGYNAQQAKTASILIREKGFVLGHQFMIGLPGDNWQHLVHTATTSIQLNPDMIRIYPTLVMKGTELARQQDYIPLSMDQAIEKTVFLLDFFEKHRIKILRVGLHPPEDESNILAGPYHPSFKSVVKSSIWNRFLKFIQQYKNPITIYVNNKDYDSARGYRMENSGIFHNRATLKPAGWVVPDTVYVKDTATSCFINRRTERDKYLDKIIGKYKDES